MTVVYGDVGGENAITGFGTGPPLPHLYDGPIAYQFFSAAQSASTSCFSDKQLAYNEAKAATCTDTTAPTDLGGETIYPGVHCNSAGFFELTAGELTLDGLGDPDAVFIFQTAMGVSTSAFTDINLINGAKAKNVYWQTGTLINLAGDSTFRGNLLAGSSIALGARTILSGRALAVTESVTLAGTNSVSTPNLTVNGGSPDEVVV
jgi:hypothetical protein